MVISRRRERAVATIDSALSPEARGSAHAIDVDLTDPRDAERAVSATVERFGRIDALVNLAGSGFGQVPFAESALENLRVDLDSYIVTAYTIASAAVRAMLTQSYRDGARSRGRIVTVTAGSSKDPAFGRALFGAAKAAVNTLMLGLARDHKADGIVANALVLGGVAFAGAEAFYSPEEFAAAAAPEEVAEVLAFLASERATGINGALVDLNARETD
jgi:NAD(P)-dependent dehydrogenase (short-subunit alcohol dehydrogenase family)